MSVDSGKGCVLGVKIVGQPDDSVCESSTKKCRVVCVWQGLCTCMRRRACVRMRAVCAYVSVCSLYMVMFSRLGAMLYFA